MRFFQKKYISIGFFVLGIFFALMMSLEMRSQFTINDSSVLCQLDLLKKEDICNINSGISKVRVLVKTFEDKVYHVQKPELVLTISQGNIPKKNELRASPMTVGGTYSRYSSINNYGIINLDDGLESKLHFAATLSLSDFNEVELFIKNNPSNQRIWLFCFLTIVFWFMAIVTRTKIFKKGKTRFILYFFYSVIASFFLFWNW